MKTYIRNATIIVNNERQYWANIGVGIHSVNYIVDNLKGYWQNFSTKNEYKTSQPVIWVPYVFTSARPENGAEWHHA